MNSVQKFLDDLSSEDSSSGIESTPSNANTIPVEKNSPAEKIFSTAISYTPMCYRSCDSMANKVMLVRGSANLLQKRINNIVKVPPYNHLRKALAFDAAQIQRDLDDIDAVIDRMRKTIIRYFG